MYNFHRRQSSIFLNTNNELLKEVNSYHLKKVNCVCGANKGWKIFSEDRYGIELDFIMCQSCGIVRAGRQIKDDDLSDFYERHYRKLYFDMEIPNQELILKEQRPRGRSIVKLINKNGINIDGKQVLEIGAGAGGILDEFTRKGAITTALEPSLSYCEYMHSNTPHKVINGMFSEKIQTRFHESGYDIIIISHVLEHVNDPIRFISQVKKSLKVDGVMYIEVPSITKIGLANDRVADFFHVAHPWSFTKRGLLSILDRLDLKSVYHDSNIRILIKSKDNENNVVIHRLYPYIVYALLIMQDLLSRLGLLGAKRRVFVKIASFMPGDLKKLLKSLKCC